MQKQFRVAAAQCALGAALFGLWITNGAVRAVDAPAPAKLSVAFVDVARVINEAKPVASLQSEFLNTRKAQQKQLDDLYAGRLLDDTERTEMETLQKAASPNATQQARLKELAKLSDDREQEMSRLSRLEKPTDAERARMTQLTNWLGRQNQRATQLQGEFEQATQQKTADLNRRALDLVLNVVQAIAQERNIDLIVDRQSVLFGKESYNLTDAVLQRMNGGSAPAASSPASKTQ